ncbi:MAG: hypothetical protein LBK54_06760 [Propionibacteriaceae bacterium]|jgi:uncharacterized membrane protein YgcG|nr:hypothetical protein [Propionibacteriaceae bacterium]
MKLQGWFVVSVAVVSLVACGFGFWRSLDARAEPGAVPEPEAPAPVCVWLRQSKAPDWFWRQCDDGTEARADIEAWHEAGYPEVEWRALLPGVEIVRLRGFTQTYFWWPRLPLSERLVAVDASAVEAAGLTVPTERDFVPGLVALRFTNPSAPNIYLQAPSGEIREIGGEEWAGLSQFTPLRQVEAIEGIENPTVVAERLAAEEAARQQAEASRNGGRSGGTSGSRTGGSSGSGSNGGTSGSGGGGTWLPDWWDTTQPTGPGTITVRCHESDGRARLSASWEHAGAWSGTATVNGYSWSIDPGDNGTSGTTWNLLPAGQNVCTVVLGGQSKTARF